MPAPSRFALTGTALLAISLSGCSNHDAPGTGHDQSEGGTTSGGTISAGGNSSSLGGVAGAHGGAVAALGGNQTSGGSAPDITGGSSPQSADGGTSTLGGVTGNGGASGSPSRGGAPSGAGAGGEPAQGGTAGAGAMTMTPCDAASAVASMRLGWNLGNSLDSVDATKSDATVETAWGNPAITPELLEAVASAGFGAVRIPVTWIGRFGSAPDYTISPAFIQRVEQVVNYALDQHLYVIINVHHDGSEGVDGQWLSLVDSSNQVTAEHTSAVRAQFEKIWAQIAQHFETYGDHLIFESMNEIKVGYDTPLQSYYDQVNGLNQAFVDTVRASPGYNPNRCLVIPGYNTNIDFTVAGFVKPMDNGAGKLILSDHYYDPWTFAGDGSTHTWGTGNAGIDDWGQEDWVRSQVAKLKSTFIDQGLPMIWGEYGAINQTGYENYRRYYLEYVTKAVHDAGIVPFFWDDGSTGSGMNAFGLIDRSDNSVLYPTILEALTRAATSSYSLSDVAKP